MITEKEYLEAKKIVDAYNEQLRIADVISCKQKADEQKEREDNCEEHYFLPSGGKWSPQGQMTCQNCGKTVG